MPTGVWLGQNALQPGFFDRRDRGDRRACKLRATLAADNHETFCRIMNLSEGGMGIDVDCVVKLKVGQKVLVSTQPLGSLPAIIRWASPPHYGVEFTGSAKQNPAVKAFYDLLPQ